MASGAGTDPTAIMMQFDIAFQGHLQQRLAGFDILQVDWLYSGLNKIKVDRVHAWSSVPAGKGTYATVLTGLFELLYTFSEQNINIF